MTTAAPSRRWRCFVAVPLPDELRDELRAWVDEVRRDGRPEADWRWTDPAGWHITLAFLGSTPPEAVPRIVEGLVRTAAQAAEFSVTAGGLGGFPGRRHPRVVWYGIKDEERRLKELAIAVRAATGSVEDSAFRPHVTLARARERRGADMPTLPVDSLPSGRVPISALHLMRSHRGRGPAQYETLAEAVLGARLAASMCA